MLRLQPSKPTTGREVGGTIAKSNPLSGLIYNILCATNPLGSLANRKISTHVKKAVLDEYVLLRTVVVVVVMVVVVMVVVIVLTIVVVEVVMLS